MSRPGKVEKRDESSDKGGTMRLGAYPCLLAEDTFAMNAYKTENISERHRHRFEFNNEFKEKLVESGLVISGTSPDHGLVEIVELKDHPWYLGLPVPSGIQVQTHGAPSAFQGIYQSGPEK